MLGVKLLNRRKCFDIGCIKVWTQVWWMDLGQEETCRLIKRRTFKPAEEALQSNTSLTKCSQCWQDVFTQQIYIHFRSTDIAFLGATYVNHTMKSPWNVLLTLKYFWPCLSFPLLQKGETVKRIREEVQWFTAAFVSSRFPYFIRMYLNQQPCVRISPSHGWSF